MKIGILGSNEVGKQLGKSFLQIGHEIIIGTNKPTTIDDWLNPEQTLTFYRGTHSDAASFGDIIVLCTLWNKTKEIIYSAGIENFENKILIDITYSDENFPGLLSANEKDGEELIQQLLPNTRIVKAINILNRD